MAIDHSKPSPPVARLRGFPVGHPFVCDRIQRLARQLAPGFDKPLGGKFSLTQKGEQLLQTAMKLAGKLQGCGID